MSTHSTVSILNLDGSVSTTYCQYDGYIDGVGLALKNYVRTQESAEALVTNGPYLEICNNPCNFSSHRITVDVSLMTGCHLRFKAFEDFEDYQRNGATEEYNYIFVDDHWSVSRDNGLSFVLLEKLL